MGAGSRLSLSAHLELTATLLCLHGPCGSIHSGPINDQCRTAQKMATRRSTHSAATDNGDGGTNLKHPAVKQEEAPPVPCMSDTDAEEEAILECICRLEKKCLVSLLKRQQELEDDIATKSVDPVRGRHGRSRRLTRERRRHRHCRRCTTLSSSRNRERRVCSKRSVKKFMEERKDVKKMTPFELIEAS